jgi:acetylornithine/N-succinyldiaminopimelate aminotransferase
LLITPSPAFYNEPSIRLADALTQRSCFDRVFFANTGAEANEGAIKLARKYGALHRGGAYEIITFDGAFHGRTLAAMSASGKKQFEALFEPKVPGFPKAILNDLDSVERLIGERTVAVMLEPIQGEAGVLQASDAFLRALRELTARRGLLMIVDEVQTGMSRTGKLFAYEHAGIEPDMMTLGKGIGGGVPLAALLAKEDVCCFEHGDQGGTYNGNALMTAAGLAVLETVGAPAFLRAVESMGAYLAGELERLSARHGLGSVRGRGLLLALDLGRPIGGDVVTRAREAGLLINSPRPDSLRFMPALNVTREEIGQMIAMLDRALAQGG